MKKEMLYLLFLCVLVASQVCFKQQCVENGVSCPSTKNSICIACTSSFQVCQQANINNGTLLCNCYVNFLSCLKQADYCFAEYNNAATSCSSTFGPGSFYGNPCNCSTVIVPGIINYPTCYRDTSYCDPVSGRCSPLTPNGQCTDANDQRCGNPNAGFLLATSNFQCSNASGTPLCTMKANMQAAGDTCTTSLDCIDNAPCNGGICQGLTTGATCSNSKSCAWGYWCNTNACQPSGGIGEICTSADGCTYPNVCGYSGSSTGGKCVAPNSMGNGQLCLSTSECQYGYYCNKKGNVQPFAAGACQPDMSTTIACNNLTDCMPYDATCGCDTGGNRVCLNAYFHPPAACSTQDKTVQDCLISNRCKGMGLNSCGQKYCGNAISCLDNCYINNSPAFKTRAACIKNISPTVCNTKVNVATSPAFLLWLSVFASFLSFC